VEGCAGRRESDVGDDTLDFPEEAIKHAAVATPAKRATPVTVEDMPTKVVVFFIMSNKKRNQTILYANV